MRRGDCLKDVRLRTFSTIRASGPEEIAYCRSTGKTVTPYLCSRSGNTDPYLEYHRFRGIRSFWMGYDGFGNVLRNPDGGVILYTKLTDAIFVYMRSR